MKPTMVLFTKTHARVLAPGLSELDLALPDDVADRSPLSVRWRQFERALEDFIEQELVAA
jgi:hypothetical protein